MNNFNIYNIRLFFLKKKIKKINFFVLILRSLLKLYCKPGGNKMFSKNNKKMIIQKEQEKINYYGIKKFNAGTASVLIAAGFAF